MDSDYNFGNYFDNVLSVNVPQSLLLPQRRLHDYFRQRTKPTTHETISIKNFSVTRYVNTKYVKTFKNNIKLIL